MQLVQRPEEYDVLVLPNLYGDVLSDLCAGMIGGLGLAPGANFGEGIAIFEPTHGSAPKYAGQNKVNPMAQMLSGMLMLRHLEEQEAADSLERAIAEVIREGKSVTYDMKPTRDDPTAVGTSEVADAIIDKLGATRMSSARCTDRRRRKRRRDMVAQVARRTRDYADVVLVDIKEGPAAGKGARHQPDGRGARLRAQVTGSNSYEETAGSDVVVITAGLPRSPGMSRDDLVATNEKIVKDPSPRRRSRRARTRS